MKDIHRMFHWLLIAVFLYAVAGTLAAAGAQPQLQIVLWKTGHITIAAFAGYWIDRQAFGHTRLNSDSAPQLQIRRAIVIGAAMLAMAMGL